MFNYSRDLSDYEREQRRRALLGEITDGTDWDRAAVAILDRIPRMGARVAKIRDLLLISANACAAELYTQ